MDEKAAAQAQSDVETGGSFSEAVDRHIESWLVGVNTLKPGIIHSFDTSTQTARVQPAIKRIFTERGAVDLPLCLDVPVQFPRYGNMVLTGMPAAGDECLLAFSDRAIDFWWKHGGVQLPAKGRMFSLSDAFAIMGFSSKPRAIENFFTGGMELRTLDGDTIVRLEDGMVTLGGAAGAVPAVNGTNLVAYLTTLAGAVPSAPPPTTGPTSILATKVKVK